MKRLAPLAILLAVGCSDPVEPPPPPPPFVVTITDNQRVQGTRGTDESGVPNLECSFQIDAAATGGKSGTYATWIGAGLAWRREDGRTHNTELTALEITDYFGSDRIMSGSDYQARRRASWTAPFRLHYTFRYLMPSGETRSHDYYMYCD